MKNDFVRIYQGHNPESNIVGFSLGVWNAPKEERFRTFMEDRGYSWNWTDHRPKATASLDHIEVRPPLTDEHIQEFGALMMGGVVDGRYQLGMFQGFGDVYATDNRHELPMNVFDRTNSINVNVARPRVGVL